MKSKQRLVNFSLFAHGVESALPKPSEVLRAVRLGPEPEGKARVFSEIMFPKGLRPEITQGRVKEDCADLARNFAKQSVVGEERTSKNAEQRPYRMGAGAPVGF